ncbi:MAG: Cytochrome c-type protein NapC [uncultured Thiotrichaceae bacterium]|uniref:Cytochrome c-type protein n=1 Tax=uncultured Thiotrichaceae bacterium TaxID=298394 RepID=A0A6S6UDZ4_9GAMM|nr:MAG: Cytochrome c-type protein NapC [uncultured Thiotrichaceae bacterium]
MAGRSKISFILILVLGAALMSVFNVGLKATNTTEFCTSCHSMQTNLNELKETPHWSSASGVHAGCADCHVPKAFIPKMKAKILAAKDVYHEIAGTIDTPEKYEKHRWDMASRVWKKMEDSDSRECRSCHSFDHMDLSAQDKSARKRHGRAEEQGKTCIDCHKGVAHEEPDEPEEDDKH